MDKQEQLVECLERLRARHHHFTWEADFGDLVLLVAQVQLALRHPGNTGHAAQRVRTVIDHVICAMEQSEPEIGPLLRLGYDPAHDVERR